MDDEDYNFDEEYGGFQPPEIDFLPEVDALERVGYLENDVLGDLTGQLEYTHKKGEIIYDPIKRFGIYVDASARKLIQEGYISEYVSQREISLILNGIDRVKNARYKNPDGFVLGYAATKSGRIDKTKISALAPKLKSLDPPLQITDLIRYANLWMTIA